MDVKLLLEYYNKLPEAVKIELEEQYWLLTEKAGRRLLKLFQSERWKQAGDEEKERFFKKAIQEGLKEATEEIERKKAKLPAVYKQSPKLADIESLIFKGGRRFLKHYLGTENGQHLWAIPSGRAKFPEKDQDYLQSRLKAGILLPLPPKLETQIDNLWAIGYLLQAKNQERVWAGKPPVFELEFTLSEYARVRGYTDEEIRKWSGKVIKELKKDLITGAKTTYDIQLTTKEGEKGILHGLPNFYMLFEPEKKKGKWKIFINDFYKACFLPGGQYYGIPASVIADRQRGHDETMFVQLIVKYAGNWKGKDQYPLTVARVIEGITDDKQIISRPAEAYKVLAKCLTYAYYKDLLARVAFFSPDLKRDYPVNNLSVFEVWSYQDFKDKVLAQIGLKDIRKSRIRFFQKEQDLKPIEIELKAEEWSYIEPEPGQKTNLRG